MQKTYRCLILTNAYVLNPSLAYFRDRMSEEFSLLEIESESKTAAEIFAHVAGDGSIQHEPLPYDFVLYLDKDRYLASLLEKCGLRLFNSAAAIEACDDKMLTHLALADQGIAMPATVSGPLCYVPSHDRTFINNLMKAIPFPMVAKANYGSQGQSVYLVENEAQLLEMESKLQNQARIYQQFIATSKGFDDRIIVIGGRFYCGYRRRSLNGDFRSNIAQGGTGEAHEMSKAQIDIAEKAARILGLDYCGVDLLDSGDPEKPILCEVNSNAFFRGAEKVTGKNVAKAYAEYIVQSVYESKSAK